ncbi:YARHG domain-containing protein [Neptunitalea lumnitzerae]|uniref:YARHG domain-containing protein n=1 Tax=Neptunitalea lumnitzerae TaxID=2965509 RepID=A0ABQ5MET5_9FLAO|nr:YARHG domain-containing protein [Neptunitalea sp. Y10]GLB47912.1 hypothetical protein Y10_02800 [Neptunitalea sp. Y10]
MKKITALCLLAATTFSCKEIVKNNEVAVIEEPGTEVVTTPKTSTPEPEKIASSVEKHPLTGYWVGFFKNAQNKEDEEEYYDDYLGRYPKNQNKINLAIEKVADTTVTGYSVVSGNERPFTGTITENDGVTFAVTLEEPGDNTYDGTFTFIMTKHSLRGTWTPFKKGSTIKRKYVLEKKTFTYNPNIKLDEDKRLIKWEESKPVLDTFGYDIPEPDSLGNQEINYHVYENTGYPSSSEKIYTINASKQVLTEADVENLTKTDLYLIRNTIYARHGYSFKNKELRAFFDNQSWYIPMYANIREVLTPLEKKNIELLLRYEKNATEYYITFGR